jgi:hypothetical protein
MFLFSIKYPLIKIYIFFRRFDITQRSGQHIMWHHWSPYLSHRLRISVKIDGRILRSTKAKQLLAAWYLCQVSSLILNFFKVIRGKGLLGYKGTRASHKPIFRYKIGKRGWMIERFYSDTEGNHAVFIIGPTPCNKIRKIYRILGFRTGHYEEFGVRRCSTV